MDVLKDPREVYHPAEKMWSPKPPSNSNNAVETAKSASSSAEQADTARKMRYHGGSGRPAEVIAVGCSLVSSSVHQCMYGCVRAARAPPKDAGRRAWWRRRRQDRQDGWRARANCQGAKEATRAAKTPAGTAPHLRAPTARASAARAETRRGGGVKARAFAASPFQPGAALQGAMY